MPRFDFSKVGKAEMSERGEPLSPNVRSTGVVDDKGKAVTEKYAANYTLKVRRCIAKRSRNSKDLFIAECEVLASDNTEHVVGCKRTWIQDMGNDSGPGALKGFVVACMGIDHRSADGKAQIKALEDKFEDIITEALEDASDPACKNGFADTVIKVEVREIETKPKTAGGAPGKFNLHTFSPAPQPASKAA